MRYIAGILIMLAIAFVAIALAWAFLFEKAVLAVLAGRQKKRE